MSSIQLAKTLSFDEDSRTWKLRIESLGLNAPSKIFLVERFFGPKTGFTGADSDYALEGPSPRVSWSEQKYLRVATESEILKYPKADPINTAPRFNDLNDKLLKAPRFGYYKYLVPIVEEYFPTWDFAVRRYQEAKAGSLALVQVNDTTTGALELFIVGGAPSREDSESNSVYPGDKVQFGARGGSGEYTFSVVSEGDLNLSTSHMDPNTGALVVGQCGWTLTCQILVAVADGLTTESSTINLVRVLPSYEARNSTEVIQDV